MKKQTVRVGTMADEKQHAHELIEISSAWGAAKKIEWTDAARTDVRRVDRETAVRMLEGLARLLLTEEGDVKLLSDSDPKEYRLRVFRSPPTLCNCS